LFLRVFGKTDVASQIIQNVRAPNAIVDLLASEFFRQLHGGARKIAETAKSEKEELRIKPPSFKLLRKSSQTGWRAKEGQDQ
jgi:hypothetical protein